ncbi:hypothetical protein ACJX0J_040210, partial [Zea mays]
EPSCKAALISSCCFWPNTCNWRPRLLQGAGEEWAEAAIESEALLGTPALE